MTSGITARICRVDNKVLLQFTSQAKLFYQHPYTAHLAEYKDYHLISYAYPDLSNEKYIQCRGYQSLKNDIILTKTFCNDTDANAYCNTITNLVYRANQLYKLAQPLENYNPFHSDKQIFTFNVHRIIFHIHVISQAVVLVVHVPPEMVNKVLHITFAKYALHFADVKTAISDGGIFLSRETNSVFTSIMTHDKIKQLLYELQILSLKSTINDQTIKIINNDFVNLQWYTLS